MISRLAIIKSPVKVVLIVLRGDRLEWDPHKRINLLALGQLECSFDGAGALTFGVLKDSHSQGALLHLSERIASCVNTTDDQFLRILAGLLQRKDCSDGHFI